MLPGTGAASLRSPHPPERAAADTAAAPGANNTARAGARADCAGCV